MTRVVFLVFCITVLDFHQTKAAEPGLIPKPARMELRDGVFRLSPQTAIQVVDATTETGNHLAELLRPATGFPFPVKPSTDGEKANRIVLRMDDQLEHLAPEGYVLRVTPDMVDIAAPAPAGVFYGCQTLRQLLPAAIESEWSTVGVVWTVPCVRIEDKPRYSWRGLMLDPGHNFLTKEFTKRYIDVIAYYKMNRLHWHLTNMNWAIEIKKYPELTNIEKWTPITNRWRRTYGKCNRGFYTQDDVREIVAYAAKRHVVIIPEIEMPAHSSAALSCYPELA